MPFPEAERVVYSRNLLDRVICQLRFPPILTIDTKLPADFQESIRKRFPGFRAKDETAFAIPQSMQKDIPTAFLQNIVPSGDAAKNYEFISEAEDWTVNLTRTFVALTTKQYKNWEDFKEMLNAPLAALTKYYEPSHFSRVGLRYIDIVKRRELGLDNIDWSGLLDFHILGLLASPNIKADIRSYEAKYEMRLDDGNSMVRITTGLVQSPDSDETWFLIDSDFSEVGRVDRVRAMERLDYFHRQASRLIQSVITRRLHDAMGPMKDE